MGKRKERSEKREGGTLFYKQYRYVPHQRLYCFCAVCIGKWVYSVDFNQLGLTLAMVFRSGQKLDIILWGNYKL